MTIPEYVDQYFWLKHPEKRSVYAETCNTAVEKFLQSRGVYTDEQREQFIDRVGRYWDDRRDVEAERADKTILEIYGLSVEDLMTLTKERTRKRVGGKHPNHAASFREKAFLAFLESERQGNTFADAINRAADACGSGVTDKTLRNWLKSLIRYGVCDIPEPTRKKKT